METYTPNFEILQFYQFVMFLICFVGFPSSSLYHISIVLIKFGYSKKFSQQISHPYHSPLMFYGFCFHSISYFPSYFSILTFYHFSKFFSSSQYKTKTNMVHFFFSLVFFCFHLEQCVNKRHLVLMAVAIHHVRNEHICYPKSQMSK